MAPPAVILDDKPGHKGLRARPTRHRLETRLLTTVRELAWDLMEHAESLLGYATRRD